MTAIFYFITDKKYILPLNVLDEEKKFFSSINFTRSKYFTKH
jgi:hypothetical protein